MTKGKTAAIVLAAGLGTRMKSARPKVMHPIAGEPMIRRLLATLATAAIDEIVVVVGAGDDEVAAAVAPHATVVQEERLGTAHAVLSARDFLARFDGDVLVLFGADPLITPATLDRLLAERRSAADPAVVVLGFRTPEPGLYGRLILDGAGGLGAIVEARDATPEQLAVDLCNSGVMALDGRHLPGLLERIGNDNAKKEYYLTDIVALARADGLACAMVEGDADELVGVDSRADLARAEALVQERLRAAAMAEGATLLDPDTVYFSFDTRLGRDVVVEPNVFFAPGVVVGDGVVIRAFSHLEGVGIAAGARIGPFARLRPASVLLPGSRVGNFVELKKTRLGAGSKASHLTYLGDTTVGDGANIGAGVITCNYDGVDKHRTEIGDGAFIGSDTMLVAPVRVGDGAVTGAGSVITHDVPAESLAVARARQKNIPDWPQRRGRRKKK